MAREKKNPSPIVFHFFSPMWPAVYAPCAGSHGEVGDEKIGCGRARRRACGSRDWWCQRKGSTFCRGRRHHHGHVLRLGQEGRGPRGLLREPCGHRVPAADIPARGAARCGVAVRAEGRGRNPKAEAAMPLLPDPVGAKTNPMSPIMQSCHETAVHASIMAPPRPSGRPPSSRRCCATPQSR